MVGECDPLHGGTLSNAQSVSEPDMTNKTRHLDQTWYLSFRLQMHKVLRRIEATDM